MRDAHGAGGGIGEGRVLGIVIAGQGSSPSKVSKEQTVTCQFPVTGLQ